MSSKKQVPPGQHAEFYGSHVFSTGFCGVQFAKHVVSGWQFMSASEAMRSKIMAIKEDFMFFFQNCFLFFIYDKNIQNIEYLNDRNRLL